MLEERYKKNINIPNLLTTLRIVVIVPLIYWFSKEQYVLASIMLIISALSDLFDGRIARRFNQKTKLGVMLDPVADKLTLAAIVICLGIKFPFTIPFVVMLILKEVLMLAGGIYLLKKNITPSAATWYGKMSTVVFYISMVVIVGAYAIFNYENHMLMIILLSLTVICMIYSLVRYIIVFVSLLRENKK